MRLEIENITLGYTRRHVLAEGLSLSAPEGEAIALLGRNGVGKSTLLRVVAGIGRPLSGGVVLDGRDLAAMAPRERACRVAFVTTEPVAVAHLRVHEVVAMGRAPYTGWWGGLSAEDERIVGEALERVGLSAFRDKRMDRLSDGERQRAMIARALAQDTPLVLLDEPTAFLDLPNRYRMALLLRRLAHDMGKTVIYSSHDLSTAVQLCDMLWVMTAGGIAAGAPEDLMRSGVLRAMFGEMPLTLTPEGAVRIVPECENMVAVSGEMDEGTAALVGRTAERCGFRPVREKTEGTAAEVRSLPDGTFEVVDRCGGAVFPAGDFHALAVLLRRIGGC